MNFISRVLWETCGWKEGCRVSISALLPISGELRNVKVEPISLTSFSQKCIISAATFFCPQVLHCGFSSKYHPSKMSGTLSCCFYAHSETSRLSNRYEHCLSLQIQPKFQWFSRFLFFIDICMSMKAANDSQQNDVRLLTPSSHSQFSMFFPFGINHFVPH